MREKCYVDYEKGNTIQVLHFQCPLWDQDNKLVSNSKYNQTGANTFQTAWCILFKSKFNMRTVYRKSWNDCCRSIECFFSRSSFYWNAFEYSTFVKILYFKLWAIGRTCFICSKSVLFTQQILITWRELKIVRKVNAVAKTGDQNS